MVYRWQQGRLLPKTETVEVLVRIGYSEAELPREWCEDLLRATHLHRDDQPLKQIVWFKESPNGPLPVAAPGAYAFDCVP
ncbi:hypothetical protein KDAU_52100 [Dictyobacter aurantiacus]|uniref:Uncharacterized protein n=1 Tax=Dictyobacter aurantiacus TaxID=1936993 RepID=A0A401ZLX4_9CHLR|nr:hypothetical protein KDAU_52100 [Dictyobacter aurantiacus]